MPAHGSWIQSIGRWASSSSPSPAGSAGSVHTSPSASAASTIVPPPASTASPSQLRVPSGARAMADAIGHGRDPTESRQSQQESRQPQRSGSGRARPSSPPQSGQHGRCHGSRSRAPARVAGSSKGSSSSSNSTAIGGSRYGLARFASRMDARRPCHPRHPTTDRRTERRGRRRRAGGRRPHLPLRLGPGRARAPVFRRVFIGAFLSNIGSWMQNVVLGAFAYDLYRVAHVRRRAALRAARPAAPVLARRRACWPTPSTVAGCSSPCRCSRASCRFGLAVRGRRRRARRRRLLVAHRVPDRHGPGGVRPDLQRAAPGPGRPRGPRRAPSRLNSAQMNGSRVIGPIIGACMFAAVLGVVGVHRQRALAICW